MDFDELIASAQASVERAVTETLAAGHWVSYIEDGKLMRRHPDGTVEVWAELEAERQARGMG